MMTAAGRLDEIEARISTERILREGDPYYSTEAGAWDRNSTDLDHAAALVAALRAVLAVEPSRLDLEGMSADELVLAGGRNSAIGQVRAAIEGALG